MKRLLYLIVTIYAFSASKSFGQNAVSVQDSSMMKSVELGEIVIKASKDNVTYKKIPASVSVISTSQIEDNEIRSLNDISGTTPNFFMPDYGSKLTSPVYIRGIGSRINSPSVGLYVDYVPYFEKASFNFDFFDIKRIEVLRGPQGTLFGRNTMGGIVNIVTQSPVDYQGTNINLSTGNYGTYEANAGHYDRLGKKLAYSLTGNYVHNDGFYTNLFTSGKVDRLNSYGMRNRIIWEASKNLTIENIASFESSRQGGYPYSIFNDTLRSAEKINYNQYSSYDRDLFSDALLVRYSGKNFEINLTSSYQYLNDLQNIDQDFTPASLYYIVQIQDQKMISQEIVAKSTGRGKYKWLTGAYGFYQSFDNSVTADVYAQNMNYTKTYDHKIDGFALFHQSVLNDFPFKNLSLTAGLRFDLEKDILNYTYVRTLKGVFANLADTLYPSLRSIQIIPRFAVNYRLGSIDIYAVTARGYKTGGFNSTFERPEDLTFEPEYSWNYETGIKMPLLKNKLYADAALFYIDWKNQQIYQTVPSGRGSMLKNAGHTASKGIEISMKATPVKDLDLMIAYGYTNATFLSYVVDSKTSYDNNYLPYVPRHTLSGQLTKTFNIANSPVLEKIRFNLLYRGTGDIYWNESNSAIQGYYSLVDGKLSFIRNWLQFDLWARNLLATNYNAFYFEALGNKYVQVGKPARFGINLSFRF